MSRKFEQANKELAKKLHPQQKDHWKPKILTHH